MAVIYVTLLLALSAPLSAATSQEPARRSLVRRMEHPLSLEEQFDGVPGDNNPGHKGEKVQAMACGQFEDASEMCNIAFEYGNENNSTCINEDEKLICTPAICEQAAIEAGLEIIHHNNQTKRDEFQIPPDFFDVYPKGCFRTGCKGGTEQCLFFNGDGDNPSNPVGYPVCSKARYLFGNNDTASAKADGTPDDQCPDGYLRIDDFNECDAARQCMGLSKGDPFTVQNGGQDTQLPFLDYHQALDRMDYPDGCFYMEHHSFVGGLTFFNPYDADDVPSRPKGTPICRHPNELELDAIHTSGAASAANGHR